MKKILFTLLSGLVFCVFFVSCESEMGEKVSVTLPKIQKNDLYGIWVSDTFTISFVETGQGKSDAIPCFNWILSDNNELVLSYNNSFVTYIITELNYKTLKMYKLEDDDNVLSFVKRLEIEKLYGMWQLDSMVYIYKEDGSGDIVNVDEFKNTWNPNNMSKKKKFLWKTESVNLQLFTEEEGHKQYMIEALTDSLLIYSSVDSPDTKYELVRFVLQPNLDYLYGKWCSGSVYYRYDFGYRGVTWDTADDMTEDDGQPFEWKIVGVDMTHIHIMGMGASVPITYVIDELTSSVLQYHNAYGKYYKFYKVND